MSLNIQQRKPLPINVMKPTDDYPFLNATVRVLAAGFIFILLSGFLDTASSLTRKGNKLFNEKRYQSALKSYEKAQVKRPNQPEIVYNAGTALYELDQFQDANAQFEKDLSAKKSKSDKPVRVRKDLLPQAWYNYGNTLYRLGRFDDAIGAYKKTLDLNPKDKDAKHNLELLLKKKGRFEKKQKKRNLENKQKKKDQRNKDQRPSSGGGNSQKKQKKNKTPSQGSQNKKQKNQQNQNGQQGKKNPQPGQADQEKQANRKSANQPEKQQGEQPKPDASTAQSQGRNKQDEKPAQQPSGQRPGEKPVQPAKAGQNQFYLQGQMSKPDALRILNALQEAEKGLQVFRRPSKNGRKQNNSKETQYDW